MNPFVRERESQGGRESVCVLEKRKWGDCRVCAAGGFTIAAASGHFFFSFFWCVLLVLLLHQKIICFAVFFLFLTPIWMVVFVIWSEPVTGLIHLVSFWSCCCWRIVFGAVSEVALLLMVYSFSVFLRVVAFLGDQILSSFLSFW